MHGRNKKQQQGKKEKIKTQEKKMLYFKEQT